MGKRMENHRDKVFLVSQKEKDEEEIRNVPISCDWGDSNF